MASKEEILLNQVMEIAKNSNTFQERISNAILEQVKSNERVTDAIEEMVKQTQLQTTAFTDLGTKFQSLEKVVKWFRKVALPLIIVLLILLFIAVGGSAVLQKAKDLGLLNLIPGVN